MGQTAAPEFLPEKFASDSGQRERFLDEVRIARSMAPFLTTEQKRDIFYNNAARFLRLSKAEIAKHHDGALAPSARPRD